ncbi:MAG TPA: hypothetical protein DDY68_06205 [Porphyromonadaceae bacterium]|nr:hypothetical protein [Porphyromonadaceae bacterium]
MKVKVLLILILLSCIEMGAVEVVSGVDSVSYYSWNVSNKLGDFNRADVDTMMLNFHNYTLTEGNGASKAAIASMGSPMYERIYENRATTPDFLFLSVFPDYAPNPWTFRFNNNKNPCVNAWYQTAGSSKRKEEVLKLNLSMNANKKFNFGANLDYIYSRGFYANQRVRQINYNLFLSYNSDHYQLHTFFYPYNIENFENGGITDDRYVSDPSEVGGKRPSDSRSIPTRLSGEVVNKNNGLVSFLNHRYNWGYYKEVPLTTDTSLMAEEGKDSIASSFVAPLKDTLQSENELYTDSLPTIDTLLKMDTILPEPKKIETKRVFVPTHSIIHSFVYSNHNHRFFGTGLTDALYPKRYLDQKVVKDSTQLVSFQNTFTFSVLESEKNFLHTGLSGYVDWNVRKYTILNKEFQYVVEDESTVSTGLKLFKKEGKKFHYDLLGEITFCGEHCGETTLKGNLNTSFYLGKRKIEVDFYGHYIRKLPNFYYRHYHGTCYWWDNEFSFEKKLKFEASLTSKEWAGGIKGIVESLTDYVYLDSIGAKQNSGSFQVFSIMAYKNLKFGIFHWDNKIAWQYSTNSSVLPLPQWTLYSNLYLLAKVQKVLSLQFGMDCRYYSKYYAMGYEPTLGQFYVQDQVKVGNYPLIDIYLNVHLKYTRLFIMYYNAGAGIVSRDYFVAPHYPMNPHGIRLGLSVNFYN